MTAATVTVNSADQGQRSKGIIMGIEFKSIGSWDKTRNWMESMIRHDQYKDLSVYGLRGVDALSSYTPRDTGQTAESWDYTISWKGDSPTIEWFNNNIQNGAIIAVLIQYGHGTGTGGYVQGRDYINPAIRPIFDQISEDVWREVTS